MLQQDPAIVAGASLFALSGTPLAPTDPQSPARQPPPARWAAAQAALHAHAPGAPRHAVLAHRHAPQIGRLSVRDAELLSLLDVPGGEEAHARQGEAPRAHRQQGRVGAVLGAGCPAAVVEEACDVPLARRVHVRPEAGTRIGDRDALASK